MIYLTTGLPGSGKTLHTIWHFNRISEAESRPVYYHGIADLSLPWIPLEDPTKWYDVESNSIVVIDECQRIFRPAAIGAAVPKHIEMLETHRHAGIDLVLITQQPMLLHKNVRQLVGYHRHLVRMFGANRAKVHEWAECREQPKNRKDSISKTWVYPKEVFEFYKSAEVHTHKRNIPARVWFMLSAPVLAAVLVWLGWHYGISRINSAAPSVSPSPVSGQIQRQPVSTYMRPPGQQTDNPGYLTPAQYVEQQQPRIADLAFSAPVYDSVTKPIAAPYPAMCVQIRGGCKCYSQQGTRLQTSEGFCRQVVENGFFVSWDTSDKSKAPAPVAGAASVAGAPLPVAGVVSQGTLILAETKKGG